MRPPAVRDAAGRLVTDRDQRRAAAGEPVVVVGAACNRGMAVVSGVDSDIETIADLKGKKVGIWPGSTQEVVILDRLSAEGMTIKDIQVASWRLHTIQGSPIGHLAIFLVNLFV